MITFRFFHNILLSIPKTILNNIIEQYIEAYEDIEGKIDDASKADDDSLRRLIHTLKTASGTIGAEKLFDEAAIFEIALLDKEPLILVFMRPITVWWVLSKFTST